MKVESLDYILSISNHSGAAAFFEFLEDTHHYRDPMLRLAQPPELQEIVSMKAACIRTMLDAGIDQWDEIYPSESMVLEDIENGHVFTLRDETLLGSITINSTLTEEYDHIPWEHGGYPMVVFHRLMVHPDHQGKGYARTIMNYAEGLAREQEAYSVRLSAFVHNPTSLRLYDSMGYKAVGEVVFRKGTFICYEKKLQPGEPQKP